MTEPKLGSKYERIIHDMNDGTQGVVDVYSVLEAFNVTCPALQHAIKKLLCTGVRGHKNFVEDVQEASYSLERALQLHYARNGRPLVKVPPVESVPYSEAPELSVEEMMRGTV